MVVGKAECAAQNTKQNFACVYDRLVVKYPCLSLFFLSMVTNSETMLRSATSTLSWQVHLDEVCDRAAFCVDIGRSGERSGTALRSTRGVLHEFEYCRRLRSAESCRTARERQVVGRAANCTLLRAYLTLAN